MTNKEESPKFRFSRIRDLLRYAVSRFNRAQLAFGQGNLNAFDEAAYLILHILALPIEILDPWMDAVLLEEEVDAVLRIINRRIDERIPAAYLTNEAWLQGQRFYVDERVIIPRSFIGEFLENRLSPWIHTPEKIYSILELCTGSACLAILAAQAFPNAKVDAVDISKDAIDVAKKNIEDYNFTHRIETYVGDLYMPLPERRYDLIIANPPYVNDVSMRSLPEEYRKEPSIALYGGLDGMYVLKRIVHLAYPFLKENGLLIIETGKQRSRVDSLLNNLDAIWLSNQTGDDIAFILQAEKLSKINQHYKL